MRTINDMIKEKREKAKEVENKILEGVQPMDGLTLVEELIEELVEEKSVDEDINTKDSLIKDLEKIEEDACRAITEDEKVNLKKMTKDQLNDMAVEIGFKDEIKAYWKKSKIIKALKKLINK